MRRTPLARKTPLRSCSTLKARKPMKSGPRKLTAEERMWQRAVLALRFCVACHREGVQWAHENINKGMGLKTHPSRTAALCIRCHTAIDNGNRLSRDERRTMMVGYIDSTHDRIRRCGLLPLTTEGL